MAAPSQVTLLHRISSVTSSGLALEDTLAHLAALGAQATGAEACLMYVAEGEEWPLGACYPPGARQPARLAGGEHRAVIAREEGNEAFLSVPAMACGSLLGALHLYHRSPHRHTPDEIALLSFLGEQAGIAILRCRLAERFQAIAGQLGALAALAGCVSGESSPEGILARARLLVGQALGARECSITLGQPPAGDNVTLLLAGERVIGAIRVDRDHPLSSEERQFLSAAAAHLAMAIDNARLLSACVEMRRALEARKLVERAKGILQQRHGLTEEEAYLRLRNESRRLRRPMRDLAEALLLAEDFHRETP